MIITKKAISRRTVLRGIGTTLALPLLDGMVPALTALEKTPANAPKRFGVIYLPNGVVMDKFTPATDGTGFEFSPILKPLEPFRDHLTIVSGLDSGGGHSRGGTRYLTGIPPAPGGKIEAGVSIDQILGAEFSQQTQLASLELGLEVNDAGSCEGSTSCVFTNTISWRTPTMPMPTENNPRAVFQRLFGDSGSTDPKLRLARMRKQRSLLDSVTEKVSRLQRELGASDNRKFTDYLDAVRDVERRIQRAEEQGDRELPVVEQPVGIPVSFEEHIRLMFDLQALAYQTDLTRVASLMIGRELSGRSYPEIGAPESHHPTSHHGGDPAKLAKLVLVNTHHAKQCAYYLEKLQSIPEGDGTLLDNALIIYGGAMSDGNAHSGVDIPIVLAGGCAGQLKGGRHLRYPTKTPLTNMHLALLEKFGLPQEKFGDNSTGPLEGV